MSRESGIQSPPPDDEEPRQVVPLQATPTRTDRLIALLELVMCSGFPTQLALAATLALFGYLELTVGYVVILSLADTALVLGLIFFFLNSHGERPRALFLGNRPIAPEVLAGIPLTFAALGLALLALAAVRLVAPSLHPEGPNPLEELIRTPEAVVMFAITVVVAGGLREELQRAFVLRCFDRGLGGPWLGVAVGSVLFGAGHFLQGADAAIATTGLGALWAIVYLRRRSVVASIISHAGFNLLQLAQLMVAIK